MAQTTAIKRRITSVKNTRQITKAMELVSASKMRRAQDAATRSRDYRNLARAILSRLRQLTDVDKHPLYAQRPLKTRLCVVITSHRGLAGAYDGNVLRRLTTELLQDVENAVTSQVIVVGKKGAKFVARLEAVETIGVYNEFPDRPTPNDIQPILETIMSAYKLASVDAVDIIYTDYKSSINQVVTVDRLLPAAYASVPMTDDLEEAIFEPSAKEVLEQVTERLIEADLNQAFYEAQASEQSMRMMAMKNASDNAGDIIDDLTLLFNTARQSAITQELAEITGGAEAIK